VDDIFDGPVSTSQLFNLLQVDTPPVNVFDILKGNHRARF
jgi:hypothetical protein